MALTIQSLTKLKHSVIGSRTNKHLNLNLIPELVKVLGTTDALAISNATAILGSLALSILFI
jgi:hypothetical protein